MGSLETAVFFRGHRANDAMNEFAQQLIEQRELLNLSDQQFFQRTRRLGSNGIYVSPMQLEAERLTVTVSTPWRSDGSNDQLHV